MPDFTFDTPRPVDLLTEIGRGRVAVHCSDTSGETGRSTVEVRGHRAEEVVVEQDGDRIRVLEPRRGGLFHHDSLQVEIAVPTGSDLTVRTGSADLEVTGTAGAAHLRSGSGDLSVEVVGGDLQAETGSGDVTVRETRGEGRIKSGSGDVELGRVGAELTVSTGSGDVRVETVAAPTSMKTGSGDMRAHESLADVSASSGSGDLVVDRAQRGRVTAKAASGGVRLGVPPGVPVWTDLVTVSGAIRSELESAGEPAEGQDHVELRAATVSGDITLAQC